MEKIRPEDYPKKEVKKEREIIVEIGPNTTPISFYSEKMENAIKEGALYVGIDYKEEDLKKTYRREIHNFIAGDLRSLPLKDASADQVWLFNVFGESFGSDKRFFFEKQFKELARVIKEDGKIIIGETYTPAESLISHDYSDLELQKEVLIGDKLREFLKEYDMEHVLKEGTQYSPQFFMILKKRKNADNKD